MAVRKKMPKNFALKSRIVQVLKTTDDRVVSANELANLVKESGLSQQYIPNSNGIGQIVRQMKQVVGYKTMNIKGDKGETYFCKGYYLESEAAWEKWVELKVNSN